MEYLTRYRSPLGGITLASDGEALTALRFEDRESPAGTPGPEPGGVRPDVFDRAIEWLDLYFGGEEPRFTPPLKTQGTTFRKTIWELLLTIPYGRTATYGEIARTAAAKLGMPRLSAQAVGGAVGHNPIALIIPCHRVIGASGSLVGYGGGLDRKAYLLALEGVGIDRPQTQLLR